MPLLKGSSALELPMGLIWSPFSEGLSTGPRLYTWYLSSPACPSSPVFTVPPISCLPWMYLILVFLSLETANRKRGRLFLGALAQCVVLCASPWWPLQEELPLPGQSPNLSLKAIILTSCHPYSHAHASQVLSDIILWRHLASIYHLACSSHQTLVGVLSCSGFLMELTSLSLGPPHPILAYELYLSLIQGPQPCVHPMVYGAWLSWPPTYALLWQDTKACWVLPAPDCGLHTPLQSLQACCITPTKM